MMLALLIYSYARGVFSSRAIERNTHDSVPVRVLCADTHPDHDTICAFGRRNDALLRTSFAQVLELAARCAVLKVGAITVAIDGTKVLASASKHAALSHGRAEAQMRELDLQIGELLEKAEAADATPLEDGLSIPDEVARREQRKAKLAEALAEIKARAAARAESERPVYEQKLAAREAAREQGKKPRGKPPVPPDARPGSGDQYNFSDPQSRIMKMSGGHFEQSYNAPAPDAPFAEQMRHRVATRVGRERYKLRQQTVEPVLGIIKQTLGLRRYSMRGLGKVSTEWTLVSVAYNLKRLFHLGAKLAAA